jgi:25S rRNA (uracil2843-N3)-methyltransferase
MAPGRKQKAANATNNTQSPQPSGNTTQSRPNSGTVPIELQQLILNAFLRAFPFVDQLRLKTAIQEVKGHLFLRNFVEAFAKQEYLDAYAVRWSASRALGYTDIFLHKDLGQVWQHRSETSPNGQMSHSSSATRVACIGGGGGAEVAACAAAARSKALSQLEVHAVDLADWSSCLAKLETALCTPAQLSPYASDSARAANNPLISGDHFGVRFSQQDILAANEGELRNIVGGVHLCTIMFTLNELFTNSISRTTAFLLALTDTMQVGSWLLVVDSPGSYSEVKLGQGQDAKSKQYPMKWLLDHTLQRVVQSKWKKHVSDDSRWFRLNSSLKYPIELENMRYQIHLYQRVEPEVSRE